MLRLISMIVTCSCGTVSWMKQCNFQCHCKKFFLKVGNGFWKCEKKFKITSIKFIWNGVNGCGDIFSSIITQVSLLSKPKQFQTFSNKRLDYPYKILHHFNETSKIEPEFKRLTATWGRWRMDGSADISQEMSQLHHLHHLQNMNLCIWGITSQIPKYMKLIWSLKPKAIL